MTILNPIVEKNRFEDFGLANCELAMQRTGFVMGKAFKETVSSYKKPSRRSFLSFISSPWQLFFLNSFSENHSKKCNKQLCFSQFFRLFY